MLLEIIFLKLGKFLLLLRFTKADPESKTINLNKSTFPLYFSSFDYLSMTIS